MRYTMKQLLEKDSKEYLTDVAFIRLILRERSGSLTNYYSPMATRLKTVIAKFDKAVDNNKPVELD